MTIAVARDREVNINTLVTAAYRLAGLLNEGQTAEGTKSAAARQTLDFIVDGLEADGLVARNTALFDVYTVAGTYEYEVPDEVLEVVWDAKYVPASGSETTIKPVAREVYFSLPDKTTVGRPHLYWFDRSSVPNVLTVYPVPDATDDIIRCQVQRLRADNQDGFATPDFERYFHEYLRWELAHQLAMQNSLPLARCQYMASQANQMRLRAEGAAKQGINGCVYVDHRVVTG